MLRPTQTPHLLVFVPLPAKQTERVVELGAASHMGRQRCAVTTMAGDLKPLSLLDTPWIRTICSRLQLDGAPNVNRQNSFGCTVPHAGWAVPDTKSVSKSSMNWNRHQLTTSPELTANHQSPSTKTAVPRTHLLIQHPNLHPRIPPIFLEDTT
jgi:hypothetical protein